eukprot:g9036.t1
MSEDALTTRDWLDYGISLGPSIVGVLIVLLSAICVRINDKSSTRTKHRLDRRSDYLIDTYRALVKCSKDIGGSCEGIADLDFLNSVLSVVEDVYVFGDARQVKAAIRLKSVATTRARWLRGPSDAELCHMGRAYE